MKGDDKNQADAKKNAKEKSAIAQARPHRYYNYYPRQHSRWYRGHHYSWYHQW